MQVTCQDLGHMFPGTATLFSGLSFTLRPGDLAAIVGPSGSGKSTVLSILAEWLEPTHGTIRREGIRSVGWVLQNPHGVAGRTVLDHVALPLIARGTTRTDAEPRALAILADFDLSSLADRTFRTLSGGEAQRLMLARAVAKSPDLLLVDEPTAQLDSVAARTVNSVLATLAQRQTIVAIATHDPQTRDSCPIRIDLRAHAS